jgi:hypothetical protein
MRMSDDFKITRTVIAAQPGFDLVELYHNPFKFTYTPIVAWAVNVMQILDGDEDINYAVAYPLTAGGENNDLMVDGKIIRQSNGAIAFLDDEITFDKGQEVDALAYAVERAEMERKKVLGAA